MDEPNPNKATLLDVFYLGLRVAEHIHGQQPTFRKHQEALTLLSDIADGRFTLVDTPSEFRESRKSAIEKGGPLAANLKSIAQNIESEAPIVMREQRELAQRILDPSWLFGDE